MQNKVNEEVFIDFHNNLTSCSSKQQIKYLVTLFCKIYGLDPKISIMQQVRRSTKEHNSIPMYLLYSYYSNWYESLTLK